jgi:hypothetical protein
MRFILRLVALAVVLGSAACAHDIPSDPTRYDLEASALSSIRAPGPVALSNSYPEEANANVVFKLRGNTLVFDQKRLTDTALAMLARAMEKQNIAIAADATKTVALRVRVTGYRFQVFRWTGRIILEARFGDGTSTSIPSDNLSGVGFDQAFDGAVLLALKDLAEDEGFVAYMNR